MISHYVHAALALDRRDTLLNEAEVGRRAQLARARRQAAGNAVGGSLVAGTAPTRWFQTWLRLDRSHRAARRPVHRDGSAVAAGGWQPGSECPQP